MFCAGKILLILCAIQITIALSVKLDGDINLGSTWKYEYEVKSGDTAKKPQHRNRADAERIRLDEERLRKAEERLRKQAVAHRSHLTNHMRFGKTQSSTQEEKQSFLSLLAPVFNWISQYISFNSTKSKEKEDCKEPNKEDPEWNDDTDALDSDYAATDVVERSTRPLGRTPQEDSDHDSSQTQTQDSSDTRENSEIWKGLVVNGDASSSSFEANNRYNIRVSGEVEHRAGAADVTPSRLPYIYSNAHKVRDDAKIIEFTNNLYAKTMKLFDKVNKDTNEEHMRKQIKHLARSYDDKFKEFLRDTSKQTIKTRLGTQKVVLSAIEMSDRILRRLLNFMVSDIDGKGTLRNSDDTAKIFKNAIESERRHQMERACKKFGICHNGPVFSAFIADILSILLKMDSKKFNQTINVFIEVIKNTDFEGVVDKRTEEKLKNALEGVDMLKIKPMLVLLKNIITNKNKPLIVNNMSARRRIVDSTIALLEIINILDQKVSANNTKEWNELKNNLQEFSDGKRSDIFEIVAAVIENIMRNLKELDKPSLGTFSRNLGTISNS